MYKNFFIILLRNLYREKAYAGINVIGLALALACSLVLVCYIQIEMSYDKHNANHERIVRINSIITANGEEERSAFTSIVTGPLFTSEYPQAGEYLRFTKGSRRAFRYEGKEAYWDKMYFADENLFEVFTHEAKFGDLKNSLKDPRSMAVSSSFAEFYFGEEDPVGKVIKTGEFESRIAAVFEDLPENSHLTYDIVFSANSLKNRLYNADSPSPEMLKDQYIYTYMLLPPDVDVDYLNQLLKAFGEKTAYAISPTRSFILDYEASRLEDMHFDNHWQDDLPTGNIFYSYVLIVIVFLILLIASINYVNLALARAIKRRKEVFVRKTLGAGKSLLIQQFMFESTFYVLMAFFVGLGIVFFAKDLSVIADLVGGPELMMRSLTSPVLIGYVFLGVVFIGVLTGIYPAFYLIRVSSLGYRAKLGSGKVSFTDLRSILVFLQYFITIGVIAFTLLMSQQLSYVANKPIGFDSEDRVLIRLRGLDTIEKYPLIKAELEQHDGIKGVTVSSFFPGAFIPDRVTRVEGNGGGSESITINEIEVGKSFIDVMDVKMAEGREFSVRLLTDVGNSVIVNESMAKAMGWDEALGKKIFYKDSRVIGVVKDFHYSSLHQPVKPLVISLFDDDFSMIPDDIRDAIERPMIISLSDQNIYQTINYIEDVMSRFSPIHPFEYEFVDGLLDELYVSDLKLLALCGVFSIICIIISVLGLLGLSSYTGEQRKKEVAVRRVLGATTVELIFTLIRPQVILILSASIVASIVSYRAMSGWLSNFAYRTPIELWVFFAAAALVGVIALITMALQTSKTALTNPIFALRCE